MKLFPFLLMLVMKEAEFSGYVANSPSAVETLSIQFLLFQPSVEVIAP